MALARPHLHAADRTVRVLDRNDSHRFCIRAAFGDSQMLIAMAVPATAIHISPGFTAVIDRMVLAACNKAAAYV